MATSKTTQDKTTKQVAASAPAKGKSPAAKSAKSTKSAKDKLNKHGKPKLRYRVATYFKNVRLELKRVIWPSKQDMIKYTGAVLGMLVFFGILVAVIDALVVPALFAFSGLR